MNTRTARVITASNRAAAGVYADRGGPVIVAWLRERGYECPEPTLSAWKAMSGGDWAGVRCLESRVKGQGSGVRGLGSGVKK